MEKIEEKGRLLYGMGFSVIPVVAFYLMEAYEHNPFAEVRSQAQLFNILLFELIAWGLYLLIGRMQTALRIELALALAFGITNHYVMAFRSTPFVPWDIFSIRTAASVVGNYHFTVSLRVVLVTLGFAALLIIVGYFKKAPKISVAPRLGCAGIVILVLCLFVNTVQKEEFQTKHYLYPFLFTPGYMTKVNGMALTFAMNLQYVVVDKPEGYRAAEAEEILESYETEPWKQTEKLPNIIVIMDEAFSDLSVLGELQTNAEVMPFMDSMKKEKNTITGFAQVSVCGGNTANSEFEFLTGNTMAFLPQGSIPYQQYIKDETPSLASWLKELGYETYAQHPYQAAGWDREKVYPLLGFEHIDFLPDYRVNAQDCVRGYVSDEADMQHIIDTYENRETEKPAFIFNVTMQNHGGYQDTYADFTNDIHAQQNNDALDQYLSLVHRTDQALKQLIEYFEKEDEKTVVVFFGDHQPSDAVASVVEKTAEADVTKRYQVPYLIWANYAIEGAGSCNTSLNYLAAQALRAAGVPTDAYRNYLLELSETYPVLSAAGETKADEKQLLTYRKLQYYNLFE